MNIHNGFCEHGLSIGDEAISL